MHVFKNEFLGFMRGCSGSTDKVGKRDVAKGIIDGKSYPTTFRRILIDFAGKIIHTGRRIILKVSQYVYERLNIPLLWERCNNPPLII